jgi:hypothetical protein
MAALGSALILGCSEDSEKPEAASGASGGGSGGAAGDAASSGSGGDASGGGGSGGGSTGGAGTGADSGAGTNGGGGDDGGDAGGNPGDAAGGANGWGGDAGPQLTSAKLDVLLVIDNSRSMADKQQVLDRSAKTLVSRLTNPRCMNAQGNPVTAVPPSPDSPCPAGSTREMTPVRDMHIGVISSSLGGHGADTCSSQISTWNPSEDDRGELLTRGGVSTYQNRGYLVWDPTQTHSPPGETSAENLATGVAALVVGAGEIGCGYEAPLEAWYRFLIDPEPRASIAVRNSVAVLEGTNQTVLTQRSQFLRPDSAVLIVMLTDENDCSMAEGGIGWMAAQAGTPDGALFALPRATSECLTAPNSPCCRSCALVENAPPNGCQPQASDPSCTPPYHTDFTDPINLRCWEQKRRFGIDFLYPIERYVRALTSPTVPNRAGVEVQNPLFSGVRNPSLITIAGIIGVPWQDLARDHTDTGTLRYMTAAELRAKGRWAAILGDPAAGTPPADPFMRESIDPRSGTNPVTGDQIQPPTAPVALANPINGHEYQPAQRNDLQYACIFRLLAPRQCGSTSGCDCSTIDGQGNKVLCQGPNGTYGTTQYFAKAYPGLRQLELLNRMGNASVVTSICPRNLSELDQDDYAYGPVVQAIIDRIQNHIK